MSRKKILAILVLSHLLTIVLSFFGTIEIINRVDASNDLDNAFVSLIETHLLLDEKYETLLNIKDNQIESYVLEMSFEHGNQRRREALAKSIKDYYSKTNKKIPSGAQNWVK